MLGLYPMLMFLGMKNAKGLPSAMIILKMLQLKIFLRMLTVLLQTPMQIHVILKMKKVRLQFQIQLIQKIIL